MKKSNKITLFYVMSSVLLFVFMLAGGIYGIYLSVGINFMRTNVVSPADFEGGATNVSYGATANFQPSMMGVIILSAVLILLSIFYFITLIKQVIFFKQYRLVRESKFEKFIEKKTKSKTLVLFFAFLFNFLAFLAGIAGIFVNINTFLETGFSWVLYLVDALVAIFALISFVLLIVKLRIKKQIDSEAESEKDSSDKNDFIETEQEIEINQNKMMDSNYEDIDSLEYALLKLKNMKELKVITNEEYDYLRERLTGIKKAKKKTTKKSKKVTQ